MTGVRTGLAVRIDQWAKRKVYLLHCMAHRLNLVTQHAFRAIPYAGQLEAYINKLHSFYHGTEMGSSIVTFW